MVEEEEEERQGEEGKSCKFYEFWGFDDIYCGGGGGGSGSHCFVLLVLESLFLGKTVRESERK